MTGMKIDLILLSILAGMIIATQSAMSGQLSDILKNPFISSLVVFVSGTVALSLYLWISSTELPDDTMLQNTPVYLWFAGGVLSSIGLTIVYKVMPNFGVSSTLVCVVCGQLFISVLATHYGWFNLPQRSLTWYKLIGLLTVILGVYLVNSDG